MIPTSPTNNPEEYLDSSKYSKIKLKLTNANAGADVGVVLRELVTG